MAPSHDHPTHVLSVQDLDDGTIASILDRAIALENGAAPLTTDGGTAALLFLASSLRTRVGFAAAAVKVGLTPVDVPELRWEPGMSAPETLEDSLRVLSELVDVIVYRGPELDHGAVRAHSRVPVVNGGDGWAEHPVQALIDLLAIRIERGELADLDVVIVGDLRMHVSRSLLRILDRFTPRSLRLCAPRGRDGHGVDLGPDLRARTTLVHELAIEDADVIYVAGLPEGESAGSLDEAERRAFALGADELDRLRPSAVVLCPLPVIDEIVVDVRHHPAIRMFEQSGRGVSVRTAVLEHLLCS